MTILYYSPASPYSAKVRMAAFAGGIDIEAHPVNTGDEPEALISANPMGKIPTLLLDDGYALFDSRTIMQELDRMSGKTLYPRNAAKRRDAERLEAAADGLCDCLLAQVYEKRMRPEERIHQPWVDLQMRKSLRTLDWLNDHLPRVGKAPNGGQIAVAAAIGYLELRFPDLNWSRGRPKLKKFIAKMTESFPEMMALRPKG